MMQFARIELIKSINNTDFTDFNTELFLTGQTNEHAGS